MKAVNPLKQYHINTLAGLVEFAHPATATNIILTASQARQLAMELNRAAATVNDDEDLMREKKNKWLDNWYIVNDYKGPDIT